MAYNDHNYHPISTSENIHTILSTHKYFDSIFAFKIAKKLYPSTQINSFFNPTPENINTRSNREFHTHFYRRNYAYYSVIPRLRRLWNSIPQCIRDLSDLQEFKKYAKITYLSHYNVPQS